MSGIGMNEHDDDQKRIRGYLLGQLTDDERQVIEERIFTDPAFLADVQMAEEELLEDYVFKILSPDEAEKFASRLLVSPDQIRRLETTTALKQYAEEAAKKAFFRSGWWLAIAATLIIAVGIGVWIRRGTSLERTVAALNVGGESSETQSDFRVELPDLRFRSEPGENVVHERVTIPTQTSVIQLRLPVESAAYLSYEITLIREPDSTLFTLSDRQPINSGNRKMLIVRVPADALTPGEYRLALKGTTADGRVDDLGSYVSTFEESAPQ